VPAAPGRQIKITLRRKERRSFESWSLELRLEMNKNMSKFSKELIESMQQATKHAAGKKMRGLRVSKVE